MDHTRHIGIFDAANLSVSIVGAGGIGAITTLTLAKMGVGYITSFDDDRVSEENLPTQFHRLDSLNEPKVDGLAFQIAQYSDDTHFNPQMKRITATDLLYGQVVISAVDSIKARKDIWVAVKNGSVGWYIDARMSAEEFQMYVIDMSSPEKVAKYDAMISQEDDSKIPDIPCTAKATFYCGAMAAAHVGATIRKILTGVKPTYYTVHNMLYNRLFSLGEA